MNKLILRIAVFALLITAFITNPSKSEHANNALEITFGTNNAEEDYGLAGGLISTFAKETITAKINYKNYYLFSVSDIHSIERNKTLKLGFGIFGQVLKLSDYKDFKAYGKSSVTKPKTDKKIDSNKTEPIINRLKNKRVERDQIIESEDTSEKNALESLISEPKNSETKNNNKASEDSGYYDSINDSKKLPNYVLAGREIVSGTNLVQNCNESGVVVVKIRVDRSGKVIEATPGIRGTTNNSTCLLEPAKRAALTTLFNSDEYAEKIQSGKIIYEYRLAE